MIPRPEWLPPCWVGVSRSGRFRCASVSGCNSRRPDLPEAGSALFVGIIQVAIASGSFIGGAVVDAVGVPVDFRLGGVLALVALGAIVSFGMKNEKMSDLGIGTRQMH